MGLFLGLVVLAGFYLYSTRFNLESEILKPFSSLNVEKPKEEKIDYSEFVFEVLSQRKFPQGKIKLGKVLAKEANYTSYIFTYQSDGKTISGMVNVPRGSGKFPVIILLRGYADKKYYHIGLGTERSANFLAENGFLTLAPDFLGYGYSDWEDTDILKARFYRPVEVLTLLSAISSLPSADSGRIGLWAHSNGGQIALSILEITGKNYPTSLWAPMSLGFPQSVLVYLGTEDVGNIVKEKIDNFSTYNDPKKYSIAEYFSKIKTTSFIIHQATRDEMIKVEWTNSLVKELKNQGNTVSLYSYKGENHNFNYYKTTGDLLRQRDLEFFKKNLTVVK